MSVVQKVVLKLKKEVKHSVVYENTEENTVCRSVYLTKKALPFPFPKEVTMTVEAPEGNG
jgi:hypothetical protein